MTLQNARSVAEPAGEPGLNRLRATGAMPLSAALRYATAMGWAVAPGCDQGRGGRRCARVDCLVAGPHPVSGRGEVPATRNEYTIFRWWRRRRSAPVLLATGRSFDILDVPPYAADEALRRLQLTGCRLGPIACTGAGRLLIWTSTTVDSSGWPYANLDLHHRGAGQYVTAPPARHARWLEPPVPYTHRVLPDCVEILDAIVTACGQRVAATTLSHHGARRRATTARSYEDGVGRCRGGARFGWAGA